jgi:hypothetical protein
MSQPVHDLESYVRTASALLGLPIRDEHRDEVLAAFTVLRAQAALVTEFTLPETIEAAPRFIP